MGLRDPKFNTHQPIGVVVIEIPDSWSYESALREINGRLRRYYMDHRHQAGAKGTLWYRRMRPRARPGLVVHRYELCRA